MGRRGMQWIDSWVCTENRMWERRAWCAVAAAPQAIRRTTGRWTGQGTHLTKQVSHHVPRFHEAWHITLPWRPSLISSSLAQPGCSIYYSQFLLCYRASLPNILRGRCHVSSTPSLSQITANQGRERPRNRAYHHELTRTLRATLDWCLKSRPFTQTAGHSRIS
jgi:hypothetical protein